MEIGLFRKLSGPFLRLVWSGGEPWWQLTAGDTIVWMKTQDFDGVTYYDRWIKPMEGLYSGTVYAGRPPGNGPELTPWDASLNQDVDCAVGHHVAFCSMLQLGDPGYDTRFTRHTPKTQGSAYLRIPDPAHGTRTRTNTIPYGTEASAAG